MHRPMSGKVRSGFVHAVVIESTVQRSSTKSWYGALLWRPLWLQQLTQLSPALWLQRLWQLISCRRKKKKKKTIFAHNPVYTPAKPELHFFDFARALYLQASSSSVCIQEWKRWMHMHTILCAVNFLTLRRTTRQSCYLNVKTVRTHCVCQRLFGPWGTWEGRYNLTNVFFMGNLCVIFWVLFFSSSLALS